VDLVLHLNEVSWTTLAVGLVTLDVRVRRLVREGAWRYLRRYATDLKEGGGALLLAGVGHDMADQLKRTGYLGAAWAELHRPRPQYGQQVHVGPLRRGSLSRATSRAPTSGGLLSAGTWRRLARGRLGPRHRRAAPEI
jgi:hypothetical protein